MIELLISFLLLVLAVTLAAQLLGEAAQMFADVAGEQNDPTVWQAVALLRNDVQGASSCQQLALDETICNPLWLVGGPNGNVLYMTRGDELWRYAVASDGKAGKGKLLMRHLTGWSCASTGSGVLGMTLTYRRRSSRRSPLALLPAYARPFSEERSESVVFTFRGAGVATSSSW